MKWSFKRTSYSLIAILLVVQTTTYILFGAYMRQFTLFFKAYSTDSARVFGIVLPEDTWTQLWPLQGYAIANAVKRSGSTLCPVKDWRYARSEDGALDLPEGANPDALVLSWKIRWRAPFCFGADYRVNSTAGGNSTKSVFAWILFGWWEVRSERMYMN